jgi:polysaccharide export outer membrane protein
LVSARRIQGELSGKPVADADTAEAIAPAKFVSEITRLELGQQSVRETMVQKEKSTLAKSLELAGHQLSTLSQQQQKSDEAAKSDQKDLDDVRELQRRGMVPTTRVLEAKRSLLFSTSAFLQTVAQISSITREQEELKRRLVNIDDQRRLDLMRDLANANLRLVTLRARLEGTRQKLTYSSELRSQLLGGAKPDIAVVRKGERDWDRIVADEDTELLPGDVVEVSLRSERLLNSPGH